MKEHVKTSQALAVETKDVKDMEITVPLNVVIFFGIPIVYDIVLKRRSPAVWGIRPHNTAKSIVYGIAINVGMFPVTYLLFKILFNFTTEEFVQAGTLAY